MKYLLLIILFPYTVFSQSQYWNTSCDNASFLSAGQVGDTVASLTQPGCSSTFKLYYYYHASVTAASANIIDYSTSVNTSYKVYGPFDDKETGCSLIPSSLLTSGSNATSQAVTHAITADKFYILEITVTTCTTSMNLRLESAYKDNFSNQWEAQGCTECITGFRPAEGKYIVSAWVKDAAAAATITSYSKPYIRITSASMATVDLYPSGEIIDGWQRIEGEVTTVTPEDFNIQLYCTSGGNCYFDDIRIHPYDASMVSYVYDPLTLRLVAELDERNYAKFYEYDEDGKLIRIKKETEKGVMTIQETRENNSKQ